MRSLLSQKLYLNENWCFYVTHYQNGARMLHKVLDWSKRETQNLAEALVSDILSHMMAEVHKNYDLL